MSKKFNQSFKIQAVEKALNRGSEVSIVDVSTSLGVSRSALQRWISDASKQTLETNHGIDDKTKQEMRPQDWSLEKRFNLVMACASLDEEALSQRCREQGVFPHHLKQWKQDFMSGNSKSNPTKIQSEVKHLRAENKDLKKELARKEKALAEAAALLLLKKKVDAIWNNEGDC